MDKLFVMYQVAIGVKVSWHSVISKLSNVEVIKEDVLEMAKL